MANQVYLDTVQSLYVAYYGRPADPSGLQYWAERLEASDGNLSEIINAFGTSPEYASRFGDSDSSTQVNTLYQQLFGRDAEDEGRSFYTNMLDSGEKTLAEIALTISEAAQGSDRTTFEGRTTVANAFTQELDTQEEIDAYSSERGVGIGRAYLERVTEQTSSDDVLSEAAPVVETLLPVTEPETPPTGGGGTLGPTFTATLAGGHVTFGGTATGPIALTENDDHEWAFTRDGLIAKLDSKAISSIELGDNALTAEADLINQLDVNGTGELTLANLSSVIDLSSLDKDLTVTASITSNLDISESDKLGAIATYKVGSDATLTMTLEQYADTTVSGDGTLIFKDTVNALLEDGAPLEDASALKLNSYDIGESTVAEIQDLLDLDKLKDSNSENFELTDLAYSLADDYEALSAAEISDILDNAKNITIKGEASISELQGLSDNGRDINYTTVTDSATNIITNAELTDDDSSKIITKEINVVVNDESVTISKLAEVNTAIDALEGSGQVAAIHVTGLTADLIADINLIRPSALISGTKVTINDDATVNQVHEIDYANGDGDLLYDLKDDYNDIASESDIWLSNATSITLNDYAIGDRSVSEVLRLLNLDNLNNKTTLEYNLVDNFENLTPADKSAFTYVQAITVSDDFINIEQAEEFWTLAESEDVFDGTATTSNTTYTIQDAIGNYDNDAAGTKWVVNADVRVITGTAEEIYQAQYDENNGSHDIFNLVDDSVQDRLIINTGSDGNQTIDGGPGNDNISTGDGIDTVDGGNGNDYINAGADNDTVYGGSGYDTIIGGTGYDKLYGEEGRDKIYAGASASTGSTNYTTQVTGGQDGDDMYGSSDADLFIYEGSNQAELASESSTTYSTRDYITDFSLGDKIQFQGGVDDVQFFSSGSANASDVAAGDLGLSIRYEKNANVTDWDGTDTELATRIFIDVADEDGHFDDIADMHIILVGSDIDINWDGSSIVFGG